MISRKVDIREKKDENKLSDMSIEIKTCCSYVHRTDKLTFLFNANDLRNYLRKYY